MALISAYWICDICFCISNFTTAIRAILMLHWFWGAISKAVPTNHNYWQIRAEAESNRQPSVYQPFREAAPANKQIGNNKVDCWRFKVISKHTKKVKTNTDFNRTTGNVLIGRHKTLSFAQAIVVLLKSAFFRTLCVFGWNRLTFKF